MPKHSPLRVWPLLHCSLELATTQPSVGWAAWLENELNSTIAELAEARADASAVQQQLTSKLCDLLTIKQQCRDKDAQLAPFLQLLERFGCASAAELGDKLAGSQATCKQQHLVVTFYRYMWRAVSGK